MISKSDFIKRCITRSPTITETIRVGLIVMILPTKPLISANTTAISRQILLEMLSKRQRRLRPEVSGPSVRFHLDFSKLFALFHHKDRVSFLQREILLYELQQLQIFSMPVYINLQIHDVVILAVDRHQQVP